MTVCASGQLCCQTELIQLTPDSLVALTLPSASAFFGQGSKCSFLLADGSRQRDEGPDRLSGSHTGPRGDSDVVQRGL